MPHRHELPADQPIWLTDLEQRALRSLHRHGARSFVVWMTTVAVLVSVALVAGASALLNGFDDADNWLPGLVLGVIVPVIVAPPLIMFCARLIARLEVARQLLREISVTDSLTGVLNRRGFLDVLDRIDWSSEEEPVVVGMVDIDSFKTLNDTHGHSLGDRALIAVADWLRVLVGADGVVGRLGGDEFAFVSMEACPDGLPECRDFTVEGVRFSASIGTAEMTGPTTPSALHEADVALYRIKRRRSAKAAPIAS